MPQQQQQQEFLFVNPGNKTRGGHKISTSARAFVIRKARAAQPWSTKSVNARGASDALSGDQESHPIVCTRRSASSGTNSGPPRKKKSAPGDGRKPACGCGGRRGQCEHTALGGTNAGVGASTASASLSLKHEARQLNGRLDPLGVLPVRLIGADLVLMNYCKCAILDPCAQPLVEWRLRRMYGWCSRALSDEGRASGK